MSDCWISQTRQTSPGLILDQTLQRSPSIRPPGRRDEVKLQPCFLSKPDKLPMIREPSAVDVAQLVKNDPPGLADEGGHFEEFDEFLGGER